MLGWIIQQFHSAPCAKIDALNSQVCLSLDHIFMQMIFQANTVEEEFVFSVIIHVGSNTGLILQT